MAATPPSSSLSACTMSRMRRARNQYIANRLIPSPSCIALAFPLAHQSPPSCTIDALRCAVQLVGDRPGRTLDHAATPHLGAIPGDVGEPAGGLIERLAIELFFMRLLRRRLPIVATYSQQRRLDQHKPAGIIKEHAMDMKPP